MRALFFFQSYNGKHARKELFLLIFIASVIVGSVVGVAVGTVIHYRMETNRMTETVFPTVVTMEDGTKRYMVGGGQLLFPAVKKEEAGDE